MGTKYQKQIYGPLLDRIDIRIEVSSVDYEKLSADRVGESFVLIRQRAQTGRERQRAPFSKNGSLDIVCKADMRVGEIGQYCKLQADGQTLMWAARMQFTLSARTIAD